MASAWDWCLFLFKFSLFKIMCVRYEMEICEIVFISFCTLLLGILRLNSVLVVLMWMHPRRLIVMIFGGRIHHPCWVNNGTRGSYIFSFLMVAA